MWEYELKIIYFKLYSELLIQLNDEGKKGWEVINYDEEKPTKFGANYKAIILFKRHINETNR
jgi:hypothetical protein